MATKLPLHIGVADASFDYFAQTQCNCSRDALKDIDFVPQVCYNKPKKGGAHMDHKQMIERLQNAGISFAPGLSAEEISKIESTFGFRFPGEIKAFFTCAYPQDKDFFDYRDCSETNIEKFNAFQKHIEEAFLFDIEHIESNHLRELLRDTIADVTDQQLLREIVLNYLHNSPKLIPFYAHRCFFDGMDDMPIVSFWQAVDTIYYGSDLENYLENEFLDEDQGFDLKLGEIPDRMKNTGIWYYIVEV